MKEVNPSNWIGVGICHKNIIKAKNYNFTFSQLGHGAYMISSNGGKFIKEFIIIYLRNLVYF